MTPETTQIKPLEQIKALLETDNQAMISEFVEGLKTKEIVHLVGHLTSSEQTKLMTLLSPEDAADLMEEIPDAQAADIIEELEATDAAAILDKMASDEQADLIQEMDRDDVEAILNEMHPEDAEGIRTLVGYDPETAGGIMVTEFMIYNESLTVEQVVSQLRENVDSLQDFHAKYIYIKNRQGALAGVLQTWDLLIAKPTVRLADIVHREVLTVLTDTPLEDLSNFFDTYDFYGVPVIDEQRKICGVVLRKDVLEAVAERRTFEHLETQGIVGGDELRTMPVLLRSRRRLSWLSVNIVLNIVAASVIAYHQDVLSSVIALAVFLPIISDMSGCSGNQAVAVSMRELSIGLVKPGEALRVWYQEVSVGLINGIILGVLVALAAYLLEGQFLPWFGSRRSLGSKYDFGSFHRGNRSLAA